MSLDKVVVILLAVLFFGGALFLAYKSRRSKSEENQTPPVATPGQNAENKSQLSDKQRPKQK
jgi:preprotein translocase subunit SecG